MKRTAAESRHLGRIKQLPCALCERLGQQQTSPTEANHPREGQGMAQRSSDWLAYPLCYECHRGDNGLHGNRSLFHIAKVSEMDLLADTIRKLTA